MARIRTIKPEAFQSESLAEVSVHAERTMFGLSTYADDRGRAPDKPAVLNGALWPMRREHTPEELDQELTDLEKAGIVCRYVGCDGKRYVHLVNWDLHQKVERPSRSRLPRCPHHPVSPTGVDEFCARHENGPCPVGGPSPNPHRRFGEASDSPFAVSDSAGEGATSEVGAGTTQPEPKRTPSGASAENASSEASAVSLHRSFGEGSPSGPRTVDLGPRTTDLSASATAAPSTLDGMPSPPTEPKTKPRRRRASAAGVKPDDQVLGPETQGQWIGRVTRTYTDRVKLSNFPAVQSIVKRALTCGQYTEAQVVAGLNQLASNRNPVSVDSLRIAIEGQPSWANRNDNGRRGSNQHVPYRDPEDISAYKTSKI